jgi:hypothetical protein
MTTEVVFAGQQPAELDLEAVIRELDAGVDRLPEEALRTCQRHRELVTPRLIEVLAEAVRLGREGTVREGNAHFFALFLLTEFQAKAALPVILEFYALPTPVLDELLGDALTESTKRVFAVLADDRPELIESLILNRQLNEYVRWEAAAAVCQLVRDGRMPRGEAIERLARLLRTAVQQQDEWGVSIVLSELGSLNPLEMQDEIKEVFERGLADESIVRWSSFVKYYLHPAEPGNCPRLCQEEPGPIADTVEELRHWCSFSEKWRQQRAEALEGDEEDEYDGLDDEFDDEPYDEDPDDFVVSDQYEPGNWESTTIRNEAPRVGRNDPCPCGSGKKYKKCCMRVGEED